MCEGERVPSTLAVSVLTERHERLLPKRSYWNEAYRTLRVSNKIRATPDLEQRYAHFETTFALVASRLNVLLGKNRN